MLWRIFIKLAIFNKQLFEIFIRLLSKLDGCNNWAAAIKSVLDKNLLFKLMFNWTITWDIVFKIKYLNEIKKSMKTNWYIYTQNVVLFFLFLIAIMW